MHREQRTPLEDTLPKFGATSVEFNNAKHRGRELPATPCGYRSSLGSDTHNESIFTQKWERSAAGHSSIAVSASIHGARHNMSEGASTCAGGLKINAGNVSSTNIAYLPLGQPVDERKAHQALADGQDAVANSWLVCAALSPLHAEAEAVDAKLAAGAVDLRQLFRNLRELFLHA